jgi:hypothetical protein
MIRFSSACLTRTRRGAVLVWLLLGMTVIIGIVALGLDGGRMMDERRHAQGAADAAALAAAADLYKNYWQHFGKDLSGSAQSAALSSAAANGYDNDGVHNSVTVNVPPLSGNFKGLASYVEVVVQSDLPGSFSRIFTQQDTPVRARAVALGQPLKIGLILLRKTGADALLNKSMVFTLINGPIIVDSNDSAAFNQSSFGVVLANRFDITGNYINPGGGLISGRIRTGVRPTLDPLALLPVPDTTAVPVRSAAPLVINSLVPTILQPGIYQGGIQVNGLASVTLTPGVYIMDGGGFQVKNSAIVAGLEVMVYNTEGSYAAGQIKIDSANVALTAPQTGTYQGISFFQNRALTQSISITGTGATKISGVVYAAQAAINLTGNAAVGVDVLGGAYVCDSMQVTGLGGINVDLGLNPPRVPEVHLVE